MKIKTKETRPPWALAHALAASMAALSIFTAVQSYEYRELEARYLRDLERKEALALEAERLRWELGEARKSWTYNAFTGSLPDDAMRLAVKEAHAQGVDPALVMAVIAQESGGKQSAKSKAGACGLMQLMPDTAKWLKVDPSCPKQNVRGGVAYLKRLLDKYGDVLFENEKDIIIDLNKHLAIIRPKKEA